MEREYKWQAKESDDRRIAENPLVQKFCREKRELKMCAIYYDTPDHLAARQGAALRLREENDRSICCMKCGKQTQDGCTMREEFEVNAKTITEGLAALPAAGAPEELCAALNASTLQEIARTIFLRHALHLSICDENGCCEAELAFDRGQLGCKEKLLSFSEIELEYLDGDLSAFHGYAVQLQQTFGLVIQSRSKLVRALQVGQSAMESEEERP